MEYSSHVFIFDFEFSNIALVMDAGHSGKELGLTPPGGRPKPRDESDPEKTARREVRAETGLKFDILHTFKPVEVVRAGKIVMQYVYIGVAVNRGSPNLSIPGETHGWKWYEFDLANPPFDFFGVKRADLYRTYARFWRDNTFLRLTQEYQYLAWWKTVQK